MKRFAIILIFIFVSQSRADWSFDDTSAYLAILKVNYYDTSFEGAYYLKTNKCPNCDTLPLKPFFTPPIDFGSIKFYFVPSNSLVFNADIIWMGSGSIIYPDTFYLPNEFSTKPSAISFPSKIIYFYNYPMDSSYKISFAWNSINKLNFVQKLVQRGCNIGMYLYPPAVGTFQPQQAKVIIFIFSNGNETSIRQNFNIPIKNNHHITKSVLKENRILIKNNSVYLNLLGKMVFKVVKN